MPQSYTYCVPSQPFVFNFENNTVMTPWLRLDAELARRRSSWVSLAESLGATKQAVGHWKHRGIPAKYMRKAAEFVGKTIDWLEYGNDYFAQAEEFDQWRDKQPKVATRAHPENSMIQASAPMDKAGAATETIAPDVRVLMRVLDALPLDQRDGAFTAALQVLVQYLPRAAPGTQEQAPAETQASTHD
jgi:hypothetical protein